MKSGFPENETEMYPVIKEFFLKSLKCDAVFVDGDDTFVRLQRNLRIREVDVVALENPDGADPRVHLIEAKRFVKGQSFEECFNQVEAIRPSGDRLWVAFPESEWKSLPSADQRRNERKLNEYGFGLLLVTEAECYWDIKAPPNREVTDAGRSEVLQQLGFATDPFMPVVGTLGTAEAKKAAGLMALTYMVADILYKLERRKANFQRDWDSEQDKNFVDHGWFVPSINLTGKVVCELDPFGRLLEDSFPTAWVEIELSLENVSARLDRGTGFGTHVYLDDGAWKWKTISIADGIGAIKYWADRGLDETVKLMQRIDIVGRVTESLRSDFERVIRDARKCVADPLK